MKVAKVSIPLPESMRAFVERQTEFTGRCSFSEYIRELIRKEQKRELERLDAFERNLNRHQPTRQGTDNNGYRRY